MTRIRYEIETTHYLTINCAADAYAVKARADAASLALRKAVYDMLASEAMLDTVRAHKLMAEVEAAEIKNVGHGMERLQVFKLRENEDYPRVTFRAYHR